MIEHYRNIKAEKRIYCAVTRHVKKFESCMNDMKSLFYVMLHYAGVELPWEKNIENKTDAELAKAKNQYDNIFVC